MITGTKYDTGTRTLGVSYRFSTGAQVCTDNSAIYRTNLPSPCVRVQLSYMYSTGGDGMSSHRTRRLTSKIIPVLYEDILSGYVLALLSCLLLVITYYDTCSSFGLLPSKPLLFHVCVIMPGIRPSCYQP